MKVITPFLQAIGLLARPDPRDSDEKKENAELFRRVFDQSPIPIVLVTVRDSRLLEANAAAIAAFGFENRELLGQPLERLGVWADPADQARYREMLLQTGSITGFEVALRTRRGATINVLLSGSVVTLAGERCTINFLLDLSDRKRVEAALVESEERFRQLFERSPIIVTLISAPEGRIIEMNAAGLAAFGFTREAMIGRTTVELQIWADLADREQYLRALTTTGSISNFEAPMRRSNGEIFTALFSSSRIRIGDRAYSLNSLQDITERKRVEQSRDQAAALALATLESTADGILATDIHGRAETWNRICTEMWALPDEVLATHDENLIRRHVAGLLINPEVFLSKLRHLYAHPLEESIDRLELIDGRVFERYSRPMLTNGRPTGRVWSFRDISQRLLAEKALRDSEKKFRGVFDMSPVIMALATVPEGRYVEVNAAALAAFGYTRAEVLGHTADELHIWADDYDRAHFLHLLQTQGTVPTHEVRMRRKNGEPFSVLFSSSLMKIGGQTYSLNSLQDITGHKRAESKFRDLFAFAPDAIFIATQAGVITDANQRAREMFGYTLAELNGLGVDQLIPPEARPELMRRLTLYLANPVPHAMGTSAPGLLARSKSGRIFPIDISLSPLESDQGLLVVAAIRDTTEQVRMAEQRRQIEAQLRQAQKMESLGTLAGGIAHDFNNILTGMLGFVELARLDLPPDHPAQQWIANLSASGDRAKNLVRQILAFSRKDTSERAPLRLQVVAEEAVRLLRATIPAMIEIETDFAPACPPVLGDSNQVHQVLMNLCTNAWHALPEIGGRIRLTLAPRELPDAQPPGTYVCLTVTDNGSGMDPAVVDRIFDPFFTTKKTGEGTGLGLAVVHGIMQGHGGFIQVKSTPGQGTSFELYFPVIVASALPASVSASSLPRGAGESCLLVDDDTASGKALSHLLEWLGYRVTLHHDPLAALGNFRAAPGDFALVISDLAMPGMTGIQFARQVRQLRPAVPLLLISGFVSPEQQRELQALGLNHVLRKPPSVEDLARAAARCLSCDLPA